MASSPNAIKAKKRPRDQFGIEEFRVESSEKRRKIDKSRQNQFIKILSQIRASQKKEEQEREDLFTELKELIQKGDIDLTVAIKPVDWNILHLIVFFNRIDVLIHVQRSLLPKLEEQYREMLRAKTKRSEATPISMLDPSHKAVDREEISALLNETSPALLKNRQLEIILKILVSGEKIAQRATLYEQLQQLVTEDVELTITEETKGFTALHYAVDEYDIDLVRSILEHSSLEQCQVLLSTKAKWCVHSLMYKREVPDFYNKKRGFYLYHAENSEEIYVLVIHDSNTREILNLTRLAIDDRECQDILIDIKWPENKNVEVKLDDKLVKFITSNTQSKDYLTPISLAHKNNFGEILSLLVKKKDLIQIFEGLKILEKATDKKRLYEKITKFINEGGDPASKDDKGLTFLHYAACFKDSDLVQVIKQHTTPKQYAALLCIPSKKINATPYDTLQLRCKKRGSADPKLLALLNPKAAQNIQSSPQQAGGGFGFFSNPTFLGGDPVPVRPSSSSTKK